MAQNGINFNRDCFTFVHREIEDLENSSEESSDDDDHSSAEQDEEEEIKAPNELLMEVRECLPFP